MNIAVDIDFLLRDWIKALTEIYKKQIDDSFIGNGEPYLGYLWEYYPFPVYIQKEEETESDITENVLYIDESKEYEPNQDIFNKFILDNVLEIFGHAKESIPNVVSFINKFSLNDNDINVTLFSKVNGKARPSTLFFLSKYGCEVGNVRFVKDYLEIYDDFDKIFFHKSKDRSFGQILDPISKITFINSVMDLEKLEL